MKTTIQLAALCAATALLASCEDSAMAPLASQGVAGDLYVLGQQYGAWPDPGTSRLARVHDGAISNLPLGEEIATSNTAISAADGVIYLINRDDGEIIGLRNGDPSDVVFNENVGLGTNPYSVTALDGRLWVARYDSRSLLALDAKTGAAVDSIDLASHAVAADSIPHVISAKAWNGKLVAVVARLNGWKPGDSALVLVIDAKTHAVDKRVALPWKNAYGAALEGDRIAVACMGAWRSASVTGNDGGLAVVDLAQGKVTLSVSGDALGGDPSQVAFSSSAKVWASLDNKYPLTRVVPVDVASGAVGNPVAGATAVGSIAWDGTSLWMGNNDEARPYVLRVDASSGTILDSLRNAIPPGALAVLK